MNIFELLTVLFVIATGYFCGKYCGLHYGFYGWLGGFFAGAFIAIAIYCIFRRMIGVTGKKRDQL